jgi:tetratricopeptide (TPR) repeat protein
MDVILQKAVKHGVPVLLSELVSNLNGQAPFISIDGKDGRSAKSFFIMAQLAEKNGEYDKARQWYIKAKDFDALRFRAPEEFNMIIKELANKYSIPLVPMVSYFEKESPDSILGNTLFLEHLHPNRHGYYLMAKAFYETMEINHLVSNHWPSSCIEQEQNQGFTELDSVYAAINIQRLKSGWPFKPQGVPNLFVQNYKPSTLIEKTAFHAAISHQYNSLEQGHMDLGDYYAQHDQLEKACLEYNAALASLPHATPLYLRIATIFLAKQEYEKAFQVLQTSLQYQETDEADKLLGKIAFRDQRFKEAILYFKKSNLLEPEVVYFLSSAFYLDNQWENGEEYYARLKQNNPQSRYVAIVTQLRSSILQQHK